MSSPTTRVPVLFAISLLFCCLAALPSCNTGSRGVGGPDVPRPDARVPRLETVFPEGGRPGDLLTLTGVNFSSTLEKNTVLFSDFAGNDLPGVVESVSVGPFVEEVGAFSTLSVRVPTGVRSGFVGLEVETDLFGKVRPGGVGFTGAPVLLGYAIGDDGNGFTVSYSSPTAFIPGEVTLIGHNLVNNVTEAMVSDGTTTVAAPSIANGPPFTATYTLPFGLEAIVVTLPGTLFPNFCETSAIEISTNAAT